MLDGIKKLKKHHGLGLAIIKALALELLAYGVLGFLITILVVDRLSLPYGYWGYVVLFSWLFLVLLFGKYLPNLNAHKDMVEWLGDEYLEEFDQQLRKKGLRTLIKQSWFVEHKSLMEKTKPSRMRKFMK